MNEKDDESESDQALHGWGPMLRELESRVSAAESMGSEEKLELRRASGALNARERIASLLDADSFQEIGTHAGNSESDGSGVPADAFPAGFGRVAGRPVLVGAEDFTLMGGSIGLAAADKRYRLTQLALQERIPLLFMLEGAGHRMTNALRGHGRTPNDLQGLVDLSGAVPTVCLVFGASAGHGALAAPLMDFAAMEDSAALFSAGPPLVAAATGEMVTKEELGGVDVHVVKSGVVHNTAKGDEALIELGRSYLQYFPQSAWGAPPRRESEVDSAERQLDEILALIPADSRRPYKMRAVLELLVDAGTLFEVQPRFGSAVKTALAFLGGQSVAIVANDPMVRAGALDSDAAHKAARFIEIAGSFHLPVIFLADNPGVQAGKRAEEAGAIRAAARMFAAQRRLRVPKLHVTLRKAFGFGSSVMAMNPFDRQTLSVAFPGATLGAMPARGGGMAANADESAQSQLDANEAGGPYRVASSLGYDEVIDPRQLRNVLLTGLRAARGRIETSSGPLVRRGSLP